MRVRSCNIGNYQSCMHNFLLYVYTTSACALCMHLSLYYLYIYLVPQR